MQITRQIAAGRLGAYLRGEISFETLVDWAEQQMMEAEFESQSVRDVVARLGVADVREFGLTWDECQRLLNELGFAAHVHIATA